MSGTTNFEMQTVTFSALPKRTRYYHSMIDLEALERGVGYQKLPNSCVIFICEGDEPKAMMQACLQIMALGDRSSASRQAS